MVRSLALIVLLTVAAFGLDRLNTTLKASPPIMTGDVSDVLYAAGFDALADEWQTFDDGELSARILADDPATAGIRLRAEKAGVAVSSVARWHFADFDYTILAAAVGGPVDNGYGVVFRYRDPQNTYAFHISSDGFYRVVRTVNGVSKNLSTWIPSPLIQTDFGVPNTLRVVGEADSFQFFINGERVQVCIPDNPDGESTYSSLNGCAGQLLDSLMDSTFPSGQIGVTVTTPGEPEVEAAFDNVVVLVP